MAAEAPAAPAAPPAPPPPPEAIACPLCPAKGPFPSLRALEKHANFAGNLQNDARHRALWERLRGDRLGPSIPTVPATGSSYPVALPGQLPVQMTGAPGPVPPASIEDIMRYRMLNAFIRDMEKPPSPPPSAPAANNDGMNAVLLKLLERDQERALREATERQERAMREWGERIEAALSGGNASEPGEEPGGWGKYLLSVIVGVASAFSPMIAQKVQEALSAAGRPALPPPRCPDCGNLLVEGTDHSQCPSQAAVGTNGATQAEPQGRRPIARTAATMWPETKHPPPPLNCPSCSTPVAGPGPCPGCGSHLQWSAGV